MKLTLIDGDGSPLCGELRLELVKSDAVVDRAIARDGIAVFEQVEAGAAGLAVRLERSARKTPTLVPPQKS